MNAEKLCKHCNRSCPPPKGERNAFSRRHWTSAALMDWRKRQETKLLDAQLTAELNEEKRKKRSNAEQIAHLDAMFGKGKGAVKERKRLAAQISRKKRKGKKNG